MEIKSGKERRQELAKRSPFQYRVSVITIFREIYDKFRKTEAHPLGSLNGIVQDMASYSDRHPDDLKGNFSKKLGNILDGLTGGSRVEDVDHFELIDKFVWKHATSEISALNVRCHLSQLSNLLNQFYDLDSIRPFKLGEYTNVTEHLQYLDHNYIYEVDFIETMKFADSAPDQRSYYGHNHDAVRTLLAVKLLQDSNFDLALLFRNSDVSMLHFGIYIKTSNFFLLRGARDSRPLCMSLDNFWPDKHIIRTTSSIFPDCISYRITPNEYQEGASRYQLQLRRIDGELDEDKERLKHLLCVADDLIKGLDLSK